MAIKYVLKLFLKFHSTNKLVHMWTKKSKPISCNVENMYKKLQTWENEDIINWIHIPYFYNTSTYYTRVFVFQTTICLEWYRNSGWAGVEVEALQGLSQVCYSVLFHPTPNDSEWLIFIKTLKMATCHARYTQWASAFCSWATTK